MEDIDVQQVKNLFLEVDVVNSCKNLAISYFNEAKSALNKLTSIINKSESEFFEDLLNFVLNRNF